MVPIPTITASGSLTTTTFHGIPQQERLTVQREANDLVEQVRRAHALLDSLMSAPVANPADQANAALMPVGSAVSAGRAEATRLCERLDSLILAVGQI